MKDHSLFDDWKKKKLQNADFSAEYARLEPEFAAIKNAIEVRLRRKMTQNELAQRVGTKQSVISRMESGNANPSLAFLKKVADALDADLSITFTLRK